jgi:serine/threonine protein kinase/Tfp pilus assembly protein PilF
MGNHVDNRDEPAKSIFLDALEIASPEAREGYLERRCGADDRLRAEVEALLCHHQGLGDYLEHPACDPGPTRVVACRPHIEDPGTVIGPYKLLEQIGEGGMGVVYMAEQTRPVRRKVALKIIKPGMDSRQVIARFEAERQALALMDHPNIAKVLDAGATESGRPYFVMELVHGILITDYCDKAKLPIPERLGLFVQVCQAVQHAHQKGIIHRDIKPTNVLITLHDGVPVPKVIDFGIAKATGLQLTDKTLYTAFAQLIGTPLYMSPEQAEMSGLDVDTRSDIYSLGVLLYELLTGTTPFEPDTLREAAFDEVRRIIREQEPPTPSSRLGTLGKTLTDVSAKRGSDPRRLGRVVRGELDWIVMRALEKDRNRRYETANSLAADVRHYLDDEPVQACPPSAWYRLSKLARRNRVALVTTALVATALVLGTAVSTWQAVRARRAERQAEAALKVAEERRSQTRQAVDTMFTRVAEEWLSQQSQTEPIQREFLENALKFYQQLVLEEDSDPEARKGAAQAYLRIGKLQERLGLPGAEQSFRQALALSETLVREAPTNTSFRKVLAAIHNDSGINLAIEGRRIEAEREYRQAIEIQKTLLAESPQSRFCRRELARSYTNLGNLLREQLGRPAQAEDAHRESVTIRKGLVAEQPDDARTLKELGASLHNLSRTRESAGDLVEARQLLQEAVENQQAALKLKPREPVSRHYLRNHMSSLANVLRKLGKPDEAITTCRHALELDEALVKDYPLTWDYQLALADDLNELATFINHDAARQQEAERYLLRALEIRKALPSELAQAAQNQSQIGAILNNLVPILRGRGQPEKALQLLREAVVHQKAALKAEPYNPIYRRFLRYHRLNLLDVSVQLGDPAEAEKVAGELTCTSPEEYDVFRALDSSLSDAQRDTGKPLAVRDALVRVLIERSRQLIEEVIQSGANDPGLLNIAAWNLATSRYSRIHDPARAVEIARLAVEKAPQKGIFWNTLGVAYYRAGAWNAAVEALGMSMKLRKGGDGEDWFFLAMAHWQFGERDQARDWYDRAVEWMAKNRPRDGKLKRFRAEAAALLGLADLPADVFARP